MGFSRSAGSADSALSALSHTTPVNSRGPRPTRTKLPGGGAALSGGKR